MRRENNLILMIKALRSLVQGSFSGWGEGGWPRRWEFGRIFSRMGKFLRLGGREVDRRGLGRKSLWLGGVPLAGGGGMAPPLGGEGSLAGGGGMAPPLEVECSLAGGVSPVGGRGDPTQPNPKMFLWDLQLMVRRLMTENSHLRSSGTHLEASTPGTPGGTWPSAGLMPGPGPTFLTSPSEVGSTLG